MPKHCNDTYGDTTARQAITVGGVEFTQEQLAERLKCSHGTAAGKPCRRSVKMFDLVYETPRADGWGRLVDLGAVTRPDLYICPLHNLLARESIEHGDVKDPAKGVAAAERKVVQEALAMWRKNGRHAAVSAGLAESPDFVKACEALARRAL